MAADDDVVEGLLALRSGEQHDVAVGRAELADDDAQPLADVPGSVVVASLAQLRFRKADGVDVVQDDDGSAAAARSPYGGRKESLKRLLYARDFVLSRHFGPAGKVDRMEHIL